MPNRKKKFNDWDEEFRTPDSVARWEHTILDFPEVDRALALKKFARKLDDETYWRLLGKLWVEQKITHGLQSTYATLFRSRRPGREHLMSLAERETFGLLPDEFTVFRGYAMGDGLGMSWTLDRRVANWFAHREWLFTQVAPKTLIGSVKRKNAWAFFHGEKEILVPHNAVQILDQEPVDPSTAGACPKDFDLSTVLTGPLTLSFEGCEDEDVDWE